MSVEILHQGGVIEAMTTPLLIEGETLKLIWLIIKYLSE